MKYQASISFVLLWCLLISCGPKDPSKQRNPLSGLWRGVIDLQNQELPFHFRLRGNTADSLELILINGKEELEAGPVHLHGDSIIMPMHIFDTEIRALRVERGQLEGEWIKNYAEGYRLPFRAKKGESYRFEKAKTKPAFDLSGRWSVSFMAADSSGKPNAVGIFQQKEGNLTGTFLSATGDYRYLEGNVSGKKLYLSAFDGEHAYLFKAKATSSNRLEGTFWSGKSREEKWIAVRNDSASLPSADSLTFLKEGYDSLYFNFPNLAGKNVSLSDPRYKNKVVIVQLMGSWCPNCMDETKFLAEWYERNKEKPVAIIGLGYEKKDDFDYAKQRLEKMKRQLNVGYDLLVAGSADKAAAGKTLPMLNHVMAFPTTIFIDKNGNIRRIHTGFSGPGTGEAYEKYIKEFDAFVSGLLAEPASTTPRARTKAMK